VLFCVIAPWSARALLLYEKHLPPGVIDLRGLLADASVVLLVVAVVGLLLATRRTWGRALAVVVVVVFALATVAMYEFVAQFDSLHALSHAGFLADSTFVGGSVLHARYPLLLVLPLAVAIVAAMVAQPPSSRWWRWAAIAFAASAIGQIVIPASYEHDEWRQRHALQANLPIVPSSATVWQESVASDVREVFRGDLDGARWIGPLTERPNVLLVLVEAASGAHLPSVAATEGVQSATAMPKLDALAQRHVLLSHVVSHQRQTNRGEYAILCGDYPKLLTDQSKMTEQVYGTARRCLPRALRDAGYATAYVQAAPLGFMLKDQFMKRAGFEETLGDPWFEQSYARTDWGVDDRAFFEQALPRVVELHEGDRPFFATLLTVGTHHPFTLPEVDDQGDASRQELAFRWADDSLAVFIDALEEAGILEDTVVIITSDESTGLTRAANATQRLLSQSWSFAVVMLPEPVQKRIDTLYAHVDIALSVTDLLGMEREARAFVGRSWFRDYDSPRYSFAGNTYARKAIMWDSEGSAVVCGESFRDCTRSTSLEGQVFGPDRAAAVASPRSRQLLAEVARLTRSGRVAMTKEGALDLLVEDSVSVPAADGQKLLIGGQYLRVPGGTTLRVELDLEVAGERAAVEFHHDVFLNGYSQFVRGGVALKAGERWRLAYDIEVLGDSGQLVVQLYATTVEGTVAEIEIHEARLTMIEGPVSTSRASVIRDEVAPATPR
jgi:phosphoglycerol transferase MdoB-like AlkP superfamily enzyme